MGELMKVSGRLCAKDFLAFLKGALLVCVHFLGHSLGTATFPCQNELWAHLQEQWAKLPPATIANLVTSICSSTSNQ